MRVLVIEDDPEIRAMICRMLPSDKYDVKEAANGRNALFQLNEQDNFDLAITDILMPEKEGLETIIELKRHHRHIKILAMSGGGLGSAQDYLTMAKELGADGTLKKPFIKDELLAAIENIMQQNHPDLN
jgi:DNA-binding response OmpR family regulator